MATRIPPKEITGLRGAVVKMFSKRMLGQVPATLGVGWHNPAVLQGFFAIGGKARKWDKCDLDLKSLHGGGVPRGLHVVSRLRLLPGAE